MSEETNNNNNNEEEEVDNGIVRIVQEFLPLAEQIRDLQNNLDYYQNLPIHKHKVRFDSNARVAITNCARDTLYRTLGSRCLNGNLPQYFRPFSHWGDDEDWHEYWQVDCVRMDLPVDLGFRILIGEDIVFDTAMVECSLRFRSIQDRITHMCIDHTADSGWSMLCCFVLEVTEHVPIGMVQTIFLEATMSEEQASELERNPPCSLDQFRDFFPLYHASIDKFYVNAPLMEELVPFAEEQLVRRRPRLLGVPIPPELLEE